MGHNEVLFDRLIADALASGACRAVVISARAVRTDLSFRTMCASNACGMYGKCWTCPPDIGEAEELIASLSRYEYVLVYQFIGTLEDSYDYEGMIEAKRTHFGISKNLSRCICDLPIRSLHLGAGGCGMCPTCAKREGKPCRTPSLALASLEAYCIHVSELAKAAGMRYTNGENTVTYFGAVFFSANDAGSDAERTECK